jgi:hypothetical protein
MHFSHHSNQHKYNADLQLFFREYLREYCGSVVDPEASFGKDEVEAIVGAAKKEGGGIKIMIKW